MLKNYVKIAFRNLWRHRTFSFINIAGLSIGLASGFIILLYSINELSYDRYNKNLDRIYLVTSKLPVPNREWTEPNTPFQLGPMLKDQFPEVKEVARFRDGRCSIKWGDRTFSDLRCISCDPSIFKILTLPLVEGSVQEFFTEKNSIVMSRQMAQRCFGSKDPIGEIVTLDFYGDSYDLKVSAVMKDIPRTSTLRADVIVPISVAEGFIEKIWSNADKYPLQSWRLQLLPTYVLLSSSNEAGQLEKKLVSFSSAHSDPNFPIQYHLFPLKDVYFYSSDFVNNRFPTGDITDVFIYSAIALLTLLIACINFIILSTGRASTRTKEIGIRKVVGASRLDLVKQVMTESVLIAVLSLPVALLLVESFLPYLSELLGKELPANYFHNWQFLLSFTAIAVVVGFLSGGYVSFYLSGFSPIDIFRNKLSTGSSRATFRKVMVTIQMVIFIGLITASVTIYRQMRYLHDKDMGFDKKDLLVFYSDNDNIGRSFEAFKAELKSNPDITDVSGGQFVPGTESSAVVTIVNRSDPTKKVTCEIFSVDRDFFQTMRMKFLHGKGFAGSPAGESQNTVVMSESALKAFGIKDPSQELFNDQRILGVVKDPIMHSLHESIVPTLFSNDTRYLREIVVRVRSSASISSAIHFIEERSKEFNDGKPMTYQLFDDRLNDLYADDYKFAKMIGYFTGLAIVIACLGLFGVSLFVTQQRVKEIGVRKVMGASVSNILYILEREFVALVLVSAVISIPIAIYFINGWLKSYAYHVSVNLLAIGSTVLAAMIIVLLTVGFQAVKAAVVNPAKSLRYE